MDPLARVSHLLSQIDDSKKNPDSSAEDSDTDAIDIVERKDRKRPPKRSNFSHYLAIESIGGVRFHPTNNTEMVFIYDAPGVYEIYHTSLTQEPIWPHRLTYTENRCTNPRYLADGSIVYVSDHRGDEHFQLFVIDTNNKTHKLSSIGDKKSKHRQLFVTRHYLYYSANIEDKAKFDTYRHRIPLHEHKPQIICPKLTGIIGVNAESPFDENLSIVRYYHHNRHCDLILVDMNGCSDDDAHNGKGGKQTYLTLELNSPTTSVWTAIRFLDEKHVLCNTTYRCDFNRPLILNIETKRVLFFEHIEQSVQWDYMHFTFNSNDKYTYFVQNEHGYSQLYRAVFALDETCTKGIVSELRNIRLPHDNKCVISVRDQRMFTSAMCLSSNNKMLALTLSSSTNPANLYVINVDVDDEKQDAEMTCDQISDVSMPGLNTSEFVACELRSFESFDKLKIHYFRYKPRNQALCRKNKKFPALVVLHGGPESQYKPAFNAIAQFYVAAGFMVIAPNIRGSRGYGRAFMEADNVEKRMDSVRDVEQLVKHLSECDEDVDCDRLIVSGGSYGGFMVLSVITTYPDLFIGDRKSVV